MAADEDVQGRLQLSQKRVHCIPLGVEVSFAALEQGAGPDDEPRCRERGGSRESGGNRTRVGIASFGNVCVCSLRFIPGGPEEETARAHPGST